MRDDTLILCYHAVSETWPADLSVTPSDLEAQVSHKLDRGYRALTLTQSRAADRPAKALVVTFDDGYLSTLTEAARVLEPLGVPVTLFVPTDHIGKDGPMSWPGIEMWSEGPHREELRPLSWEQVRSLADRGWEIGSHACSHPRLTELDDEQLARELTESRATIERQLGGSCDTIAYPYGDVDARVVAAARDAGYETGVGLPARWTDDGDPLLLPRVGVYHGQRGAKLRLKMSPTIRRLRLPGGR